MQASQNSSPDINYNEYSNEEIKNATKNYKE